MNTERLIIFFITFFILTNCSFSQIKTVEGMDYIIYIEKPIDWTQLSKDKYLYNEVYYLIVPNNIEENGQTNIKMIANGFSKAQPFSEFIDEFNKEMKEKATVKNTKEIKIKSNNLKKDNFVTGKYKTYKYTTQNDENYCITFIECKTTILQLTFTYYDDSKFTEHFDTFKKVVQSVKIEEKKVD